MYVKPRFNGSRTFAVAAEELFMVIIVSSTAVSPGREAQTTSTNILVENRVRMQAIVPRGIVFFGYNNRENKKKCLSQISKFEFGTVTASKNHT
jgi:hypothetical protein